MPDERHEPSAQELEELARRYVDLWQDQMTALAADPDFAESLQKVMAAMGVAASGLPALWSAWPAALAGVMAAARPEGQTPGETQEAARDSAGGSPHGTAKSAGTGPKAPGAAPSAAAPDGGGADLGILAERLAALEQRVRELEGSVEGGTGRARRGARGKPQRH